VQITFIGEEAVGDGVSKDKFFEDLHSPLALHLRLTGGLEAL